MACNHYEDSTRTTLQEQSKENSLKEYPQVKKDRRLKQYMKAAHRGLQEFVRTWKIV